MHPYDLNLIQNLLTSTTILFYFIKFPEKKMVSINIQKFKIVYKFMNEIIIIIIIWFSWIDDEERKGKFL